MQIEWATVGPIIAIAGLVFHAGIIHEKLRRLREEHDILEKYSHKISHETILAISTQIDRIKRALLLHVPVVRDDL